METDQAPSVCLFLRTGLGRGGKGADKGSDAEELAEHGSGWFVLFGCTWLVCGGRGLGFGQGTPLVGTDKGTRFDEQKRVCVCVGCVYVCGVWCVCVCVCVCLMYYQARNPMKMLLDFFLPSRQS
jgi:hypothetical protein